MWLYPVSGVRKHWSFEVQMMVTQKTVQVTDANGIPCGQRYIVVEFDAEHRPTDVWYMGACWKFTGKDGTNRATGRDVREMADAKDRRIWIDHDVSTIWED